MKYLLFLVCSIASFSLAASDVSNDSAQINSLKELLQNVQNFEKNELRSFKERISRFQAEKKQQTGLLNQAKKELKKKENLSKKLTSQFEDNEKQIAKLKARLEKQSGNLKELFGVVKQTSGDLRAKFQNSYITPQYPERVAVVDEFANIGYNLALS